MAERDEYEQFLKAFLTDEIYDDLLTTVRNRENKGKIVFAGESLVKTNSSKIYGNLESDEDAKLPDAKLPDAKLGDVNSEENDDNVQVSIYCTVSILPTVIKTIEKGFSIAEIELDNSSNKNILGRYNIFSHLKYYMESKHHTINIFAVYDSEGNDGTGGNTPITPNTTITPQLSPRNHQEFGGLPPLFPPKPLNITIIDDTHSGGILHIPTTLLHPTDIETPGTPTTPTTPNTPITPNRLSRLTNTLISPRSLRRSTSGSKISSRNESPVRLSHTFIRKKILVHSINLEPSLFRVWYDGNTISSSKLRKDFSSPISNSDSMSIIMPEGYKDMSYLNRLVGKYFSYDEIYEEESKIIPMSNDERIFKEYYSVLFHCIKTLNLRKFFIINFPLIEYTKAFFENIIKKLGIEPTTEFYSKIKSKTDLSDLKKSCLNDLILTEKHPKIQQLINDSLTMIENNKFNRDSKHELNVSGGILENTSISKFVENYDDRICFEDINSKDVEIKSDFFPDHLNSVIDYFSKKLKVNYNVISFKRNKTTLFYNEKIIQNILDLLEIESNNRPVIDNSRLNILDLIIQNGKIHDREIIFIFGSPRKIFRFFRGSSFQVDEKFLKIKHFDYKSVNIFSDYNKIYNSTSKHKFLFSSFFTFLILNVLYRLSRDNSFNLLPEYANMILKTIDRCLTNKITIILEKFIYHILKYRKEIGLMELSDD